MLQIPADQAYALFHKQTFLCLPAKSPEVENAAKDDAEARRSL